MQKVWISYDKYLGHSAEHMYMLSEDTGQQQVNGEEGSEDQFEDIENYFQCEIGTGKVDMRILPTVIRFNEDTYEKLSVYKF